MASFVGILTMHRVHNCGSFLQAYATQYAIQRLGCRCEVIDYIYPNEYHFNHGTSKEWATTATLYKMLKCILKRRYDDFLLYFDYWLFDKCMRVHLHMSKQTYANYEQLCKMSTSYDMLCLGSDQVLNPNFTYGDPAFMLAFRNDIPKIAYAASMTCSCLSTTIQKLYRQNLSTFKNISVREQQSADVIQTLMNIHTDVVVDPVFLLSREDWQRKFMFRQRRKKYVFVATYNYMTDVNDTMLNLLKDLLEQQDIQVISLCTLIKNLKYKKINILTPRKFLKLIANASCVITDSFHATAFSMIFHTPCFSITQGGNEDSRIADLYRRLWGGQYELLDMANQRLQVYHLKRYENVEGIKNNIDQSLKFLQTALQI